MAATATKTYIERLIENERNGGHDFTGGCQLLQYYTRETDEQALSRNASDELYVYEPCGTVGSVEIVTRGSLRRFLCLSRVGRCLPLLRWLSRCIDSKRRD